MATCMADSTAVETTSEYLRNACPSLFSADDAICAKVSYFQLIFLLGRYTSSSSCNSFGFITIIYNIDFGLTRFFNVPLLPTLFYFGLRQSPVGKMVAKKTFLLIRQSKYGVILPKIHSYRLLFSAILPTGRDAF